MCFNVASKNIENFGQMEGRGTKKAQVGCGQAVI